MDVTESATDGVGSGVLEGGAGSDVDGVGSGVLEGGGGSEDEGGGSISEGEGVGSGVDGEGLLVEIGGEVPGGGGASSSESNAINFCSIIRSRAISGDGFRIPGSRGNKKWSHRLRR